MNTATVPARPACTIEERDVCWSGGRTGTARATWGQEYMWDVMQTLQPHTHTLNQLDVVPVPAGRTLDAVLAAIGDLVTRHESLRTTFTSRDDGVWQHLTGSGRLAVPCWRAPHDAQPEPLVEGAKDRLAQLEFDLAAGPLFQAAVVLRAQAPVAVVWAASHVVCDFASRQLVSAELARLLNPLPSPEPDPVAAVQQPLEQSAREQSERGRQTNDRALAYWRDKLTQLRPGKPERARRVAASPRFRHGVLRSRAARLATETLAAAYGVSTSAVLLAGTARILAAALGTEQVVLQLTAGNRGPRAAGAITNLAQTGLATIDTGGHFGDVVRGAWTASIRAYSRAQFNFRQLNQLIEEVEREHGKPDIAYFFNDARAESHAAEAPPLDASTLTDAVGQSAFWWYAEIDHQNITFLLLTTDTPDEYDLGVLVDTEVFTPGEAEQLVRDLERLLVDEAVGTLA